VTISQAQPSREIDPLRTILRDGDQARRTAVRRVKKRTRGITVARKKYTEARREATANLKLDKKKINAANRKRVSAVAKDKRKARRKQLSDSLKALWKQFKEKYPVAKRVKTVEALRRLTDVVKHHRLR
jgi:hypothetical protein